MKTIIATALVAIGSVNAQRAVKDFKTSMPSVEVDAVVSENAEFVNMVAKPVDPTSLDFWKQLAKTHGPQNAKRALDSLYAGVPCRLVDSRGNETVLAPPGYDPTALANMDWSKVRASA
jgi:hypothetical protein